MLFFNVYVYIFYFKISEAEIRDLFDEYKHYKDKLNIYFMMRVTLAPLIEAAILLDRLLYLYENVSITRNNYILNSVGKQKFQLNMDNVINLYLQQLPR